MSRVWKLVNLSMVLLVVIVLFVRSGMLMGVGALVGGEVVIYVLGGVLFVVV